MHKEILKRSNKAKTRLFLTLSALFGAGLSKSVGRDPGAGVREPGAGGRTTDEVNRKDRKDAGSIAALAGNAVSLRLAVTVRPSRLRGKKRSFYTLSLTNRVISDGKNTSPVVFAIGTTSI